MMSLKLSDIDILNIKGTSYCCIFSRICKHEVINVMQNTYLTEKKENITNHKNLLSHIKMGKEMFVDIEIKKNYRHKSQIF